MTISDIIAKRKQRWQDGKGIEYDQKIVDSAANLICQSRELQKEIIDKPYLLIECCFHIVDKHKETVPFFFNEVQQEFIKALEEHGTAKPYYVLKGRQQGFTSLITAIQLSYAITRKNFAGFTLADTADNTRAIFNDKARVTYNRLPDILHPTEKYNSVNELYFDKLNSSWRVATATDQVGRSRTLSFVHFSEIAFFQCSLANLQKSIGEAATSDAFRVYETTANGYNEAKDLWDSGACVNLFFEWWKTSEYQSNDYQYMDNARDSWLIDRIRLLKQKGLSREQITWYCKKYDSYLDKSTIKQEYPITPEEAFVSSGRSIFDMDKLVSQMAQCDHRQDKIGKFKYSKISVPIKDNFNRTIDYEWNITDIQFEECADGFIRIHDEPKSIVKDGLLKKCPYAIGGDTAGTGIDYFTGKVIDNTNGNTVATLRVQRIDEDIFAEQMYCLGKYYNDAIIGIETNYSRHPTRILQTKYRYPKLYLRERLDRNSDSVEMVAGFETTAKTKPIILAELVQIFRDNPDIEVDMETLKEMSTFVKKDNGSMSAIDGCHDDLVMALAIAHHVGFQQSTKYEVNREEDEDEKWLQENFNKEVEDNSNRDYWEDL